MSAHPSPYEHQFEKVMRLADDQDREDLVAELLRHGPSLCESLCDFLSRQEHHPRLAPLLDLLGKIMQDRTIAFLMRYLECEVPQLRRAAATALGWNRARASLAKLDEMEGTDPDERVRRECRAAIEEILIDFPKLRTTLQYHQTMERFDPAGTQPGEGEEDSPDKDQRMRLMAALPRLLAVKYTAVPLQYSPEKGLHIAVPRGLERRLAGRLAELTGENVEIHSWAPDRINKAIEEFYTLGDDDFCAFAGGMTPAAREEVIQMVLGAVRPEEPCCPLIEANDAVEAAQIFLSACCKLGVRQARIVYTKDGVDIQCEGRDSAPVDLGKPPAGIRGRFVDALLVLARLRPAGDPPGLIRLAIPGRAPLHASLEATFEGEGGTVAVRMSEG